MGRSEPLALTVSVFWSSLEAGRQLRRFWLQAIFLLLLCPLVLSKRTPEFSTNTVGRLAVLFRHYIALDFSWLFHDGL